MSIQNAAILFRNPKKTGVKLHSIIRYKLTDYVMHPSV
jgi:hypothetical protein